MHYLKTRMADDSDSEGNTVELNESELLAHFQVNFANLSYKMNVYKRLPFAYMYPPNYLTRPLKYYYIRIISIMPNF